MARLPHLLWLGHIGGHTGLGRVSDNLLSRLADRWRITVISVSQPCDDFTVPWATIVPARRFHDWLGRLALKEVVAADPPDATVIYADPWVFADFVPFLPERLKVWGYLPVDGYNMKHAPALHRLETAIFLSPFAVREAQRGGYDGPTAVVPHGVDLALYRRGPQQEARRALGLPLEGFLLGAVGQNQPRKRWDTLLLAFRDFLALADGPLWLYCHCNPVDIGWDLPQLAQYLGIAEMVLFPQGMDRRALLPEAALAQVYQAMDLQCTASWGEGFGLTTLEGMACGIPQIVPEHTAYSDWATGAGYLLKECAPVVTVGGNNLLGFAPSVQSLVNAWAALLTSPSQRSSCTQAGLALARSPRFRWETCADQLHAILLGDAGCP